VLGPAHGAGGRLAAEGLAVAGATVIEAEGGRGAVAHWSAVAAAVRSAETEIVALLLPGVRAGPAWLQEIVPALEGSRVAAVIGAGLASEDPPSPLGLFARPQLRAHYAAIGNAPQFIALRRDLYDQVGGLDPATARLGWHAPLLDFAERALDAGLVIGRLDTHGLDPAGCHRPARVLGEWDRAWARGGLFTQRGAQLGGIAGAGSFFWEGLLPHVRLRRPGGGGRRRIRRAAFSLVAFCLGAASALKPSPRRSRPGSA
jgi:hypothetical protein